MAADEAWLGKPWADDELDAIVADYFAMLAAEQRGEPYVKSHHSAALMRRIGRTDRSVEFKHQNISAGVLQYRSDSLTFPGRVVGRVAPRAPARASRSTLMSMPITCASSTLAIMTAVSPTPP